MKKLISLLFISIMSISLVACGTNSTTGNIEPDNSIQDSIVETFEFEAEIIGVQENSILVIPVDGSSELNSSDRISVALTSVQVPFNLIEGQTVKIVYDGMIAESYPAQILNIFSIELISDIHNDDIIIFDGQEFNKSELSEETLKWLKLSEEERMLSSYFPSDLYNVSSRPADLDNRQEEWGVELSASNVTPSGLTIICNQSGGNALELTTGSFYTIQRLEDGGYINVEYLPQEYDVGWTSEAWIIQKDNTTAWDVNWEWLYGQLPIGEYRIGKEIMNFRGPGDYDTEIIYAHFSIPCSLPLADNIVSDNILA